MSDEKNAMRPVNRPNPAPQKWEVAVYHSPFMLKRAVVEAATPEEARTKFLELVRQKHEGAAQAALRQAGVGQQESVRAADRVRNQFNEAHNRRDTLEWEILPAAEAEARRRTVTERQMEAGRQMERLLEKLTEKVTAG